jgi:hypothetical protein
MSNGELNQPTATIDNSQFQADVFDMTRYMRFLGILTIIGGALYCITIIGAIVGVPVIFIGVRMREAAEYFVKYSTSQNFQDVANAIERQKRFFFINYVFAIISLVVLALYIVIMVIVLSTTLSRL